MMTSEQNLPADVQSVLDQPYRLQALEESGMFGTKRDPKFDEISALAAMAFKAPVAQVTFLQSELQWIRSSQGFDITQSPTSTSFCAHALAQADDHTIVLDATKDIRFADNPFVAEPPFVRFYAGCPVMFRGEKIGTVCVYDFEPRAEVTAEQKSTLQELAAKVTELIDQENAMAA